MDAKRQQRVARYKAKRARLDLLVSPEQLDRFKALPGLQALAYPDRLAALMDCWEERHRVTDAPSIPPARPAPGDVIDLEAVTRQLDDFDRELERGDDLANDLYRRQWPRRPEQVPARWARVLQEPEVKAALARVRAMSEQLAELLEAGGLAVNVDEVLSLGQVGQEDFEALIGQLAIKGRFLPHKLGKDICIRFETLVYSQPRRNYETWERL